MADLRKEPVTRTWVVVTTDHPKGPSDYLPFKPPYQPQEAEGVGPFCPGHKENVASMDTQQIEKILRAYRERLKDLEKDPRFQQFLILKNYPGLFNRHPHSHIIAMPVIPRRSA